ncbi:hypothetical protein LUZ63_015737 [Rhynchospora breviuscula]|uniref:Leucine-rich repeat-containing N-terminal plant-type domain-containing protein n=1 Tax=Rhynchospora breviuscula TaxID=2022672 RepID=A0A9Q0CD56_9POAL|nr:hypothetical protein LUZ63_015737 [Rhynchospora breviuscula]
MHNFLHKILVFLLVFQIFSAHCCIQHERDALLVFKAGVRDIFNRLASWRGNKCCDWEGVKCSNQTGEIPFEIGNMTSLESLDLQMNNLSGTIPQSMSLLYSLEVLNLSYNNLSGSIPTGHQLQSLDDPSIYSGNPNLCGPPLKMSCESPKNDDNNDSKSKHAGDRDNWFYLFIEFGFVVGFLVVFFILLFKRDWRYDYFRMIDSGFNRLHVLTALALERWSAERAYRFHRRLSLC